MFKKFFGLLLVVVMTTTGCTVIENDTAKKKEIDYTVSDYNEVPEEVQRIIDERKEEAFQATFTDLENTYILIGYGKQSADGYSIQLDEIYESTTNVYVKTTFKGPEKPEKSEEVTYPYIIIKIEYTDKDIKVM